MDIEYNKITPIKTPIRYGNKILTSGFCWKVKTNGIVIFYHCNFARYNSIPAKRRVSYPVQRFERGKWAHFEVPANSPCGRLLCSRLTEYQYRQSLVGAGQPHDREVGAYMQRAAGRPHSQTITEQLVPTSLIGTGVKIR